MADIFKIVPRGPNLSSEPLSVYAREGEKAFCARGCHIATFARDVRVGTVPLPDDFVFEPGMRIGLKACPQCGANTSPAPGCMYFAEKDDAQESMEGKGGQN